MSEDNVTDLENDMQR